MLSLESSAQSKLHISRLIFLFFSRTLLALLLSALSGHFWKSMETMWTGWDIWKHINQWFSDMTMADKVPFWPFYPLFWQDRSDAGDLLPLPQGGRGPVQGKDAPHLPQWKIWTRGWGGRWWGHKLNWGESESGRRFGQIVISFKLNQLVFRLWLSENYGA